MFAGDAGLALGALLPIALADFVAADVDVLTGEKVDHLGENILEELKGRVVAGAVDLVLDAGYFATWLDFWILTLSRELTCTVDG